MRGDLTAQEVAYFLVIGFRICVIRAICESFFSR
jgi:hypothetical protein